MKISSCDIYSISGGPKLGNLQSRRLVTLQYVSDRRPLRLHAAVDKGTKMVPFANYAVPIDRTIANKSSFITRPLAEILRDLNKRVPDKVIKLREDDNGAPLKYIPWYHANRMLSFYAPGWSGEVRKICFSPNGKTVTVDYRVTLRGSDGETYREATGTSSTADFTVLDPVQKAEGMAFRRACARFGLGLYLYHEEETQNPTD